MFDEIIISKYFPVLFTPARHWHPRPPIWECFSLLLSSFAPPQHIHTSSPLFSTTAAAATVVDGGDKQLVLYGHKPPCQQR